MQHLQPNTILQGGKYRIERVLGQGGFGITYLGYDNVFEQYVAIKEFFMKGVTERDDSTTGVCISNQENKKSFLEQKEKFKKEARRIHALNSEHIVRVYDLFEENDTAYYVMDYIDGETLAARMKRVNRPFAESEVRIFLLQILDALEEIHNGGIQHLDLKPSNIMVDKRGRISLIDFGASKQISPEGGVTASTAICYTPGYAPREQIEQNYDKFGPWTDLYALGATLYNILTNRRPPLSSEIDDEGRMAFTFPPSVSNDMRSYIFWLMQPNRKKRPQKVMRPAWKVAKPDNVSMINIPNNEETIVGTSAPLTTPKKSESLSNLLEDDIYILPV